MSGAYKPDPDAMVVGNKKFEFKKIQNQFMENDLTLAFVTEGFSMKATMAGLTLEGKLELGTMGELQQYAALLSEAWKARHSLKLNLSSSLSGH